MQETERYPAAGRIRLAGDPAELLARATGSATTGSGTTGSPANGSDGRFDLISGLALPLPVAVISELLGIPPADRPRLVAWSDALARALDPPFLVPEEERDELIGLCILLLVAGHETTRSLIGAAVLALLRHPAELAALAARPSLVGQAVEEALRYDPPVQMVGRFALRSTEVASVAIAAGSFTLLLLGAANRDEALCVDAERFSVTRDGQRNLAFGHGIHFCLGAPLARLETATALRQLLPLLPRLRIAAEPQWRPNMVLRGLEHLWLEPVPAR